VSGHISNESNRVPDSVVIDALKGIQGVGIFHLLFVCHDCGQHPFLMLLLHVAALSYGQRGKSAIWLGIQLPNDIFCGCPVALEASASLLSFKRLPLSRFEASLAAGPHSTHRAQL
jgi:hypothetical protein